MPHTELNSHDQLPNKQKCRSNVKKLLWAWSAGFVWQQFFRVVTPVPSVQPASWGQGGEHLQQPSLSWQPFGSLLLHHIKAAGIKVGQCAPTVAITNGPLHATQACFIRLFRYCSTCLPGAVNCLLWWAGCRGIYLQGRMTTELTA